MAGMGKRLRPHTLTIPKPLIPIAGKPIVQHLVEDIVSLMGSAPSEIAFVTGHFGRETEQMLVQIAENLGARGHIVYQDEALGTAHAVWCAGKWLNGKTIVAFADTLFRADFTLDDTKDGVLWVKQIEDPSAFGVVKLDADGHIRDFVEKPKTFVSDLAMIGIYYFKKGQELLSELNFLIDNDITKGGEYQLPDALRRLTDRGLNFAPGAVDEWMDCGNPAVTIETNLRVLQHKHPHSLIDPSAHIEHSTVIPPCYIGPGVRLERSVVGPGVSLGAGTTVIDSVLRNSIVQQHTHIRAQVIDRSMVGSHVQVHGRAHTLSIGDYTQIHITH
jgi:glucose-1-phosphate thymidylyltransferase